MWNARSIAFALTLAALPLAGLDARGAAPAPPPLPGAARLSPDLSLYLQRVRFERRGALPHALTVVIAFAQAPGEATLRRLEGAGVAFRRLPGHAERAHVGRFYGSFVRNNNNKIHTSQMLCPLNEVSHLPASGQVHHRFTIVDCSKNLCLFSYCSKRMREG